MFNEIDIEDVESQLEEIRGTKKKKHDLKDLSDPKLSSRDMDEIFCDWD